MNKIKAGKVPMPEEGKKIYAKAECQFSVRNRDILKNGVSA